MLGTSFVISALQGGVHAVFCMVSSSLYHVSAGTVTIVVCRDEHAELLGLLRSCSALCALSHMYTAKYATLSLNYDFTQ